MSALSMLRDELVRSVRRLLRTPRFAVSVVLTLGLGMAVAVSMFSVLYGVVLKALPYPESGQLFTVAMNDRSKGLEAATLTPREALEVMRGLDSAQSVGLYHWNGWTLQGDEPRTITVVQVDAGFFGTLAVPAKAGRWLDVNDRSDLDVRRVVVSESFAHKYLAPGQEALGALLEFEGLRAEVVGVMPASFTFPAAVDLWGVMDEASMRSNAAVYQNARWVEAIVRLAPSANADALAAEVSAKARGITLGPSAETLESTTQGLLDRSIGDVRPIVQGLFLIALLVLLIALSNATNLILVRGIDQLHTLALAQALGASPRAIARQLGIETLVLAVLAGALALVVTWAVLAGVLPLAAKDLPRQDEIALHAPVFVFALALVGLSAWAASAWPARALLKLGADMLLRSGSVRATSARSAWRHGSAVAAIALSSAALVISLVLAGHLYRLATRDLGFSPDRVLSVQLWPRSPNTPASFAALLDEPLRALPSVSALGFTNVMPLGFVGSMQSDLERIGSSETIELQARVRTASPELLGMLQTPLLRGRFLLDSDRQGSERVAVINASLAQAVFGDADPIGEQLSLPAFGADANGERLAFRVVGVHADFRNVTVSAPVQPELMVPLSQYPLQSLVILLRSNGDPALLKRAVKQVVAQIDPAQGIYGMEVLADSLHEQLTAPRFFAAGAGLFAFLAVLLAMLGLYGLLAFALAQRARERAIKAALGASAGRLAKDVGKHVAWVGGSGLMLGLALAQVLRPWIDPMLGMDASWFAASLQSIVALAPLLMVLALWNARAASKPSLAGLLRG